ncbi:MAG: 7-carboxy-7-deazaguanine synthase QueE [Deltaproteobacteria bacterium]|nr:7-carboxy-7-deazaguanine synthase QueE [Deltaproteobacteria bacterium]
MQEAKLIEIFSSFQGEGPYIGAAMTFIRFQHCAFSCQYCDTPNSFRKLKEYRVEHPQGSGNFEFHSNPASVENIQNWIKKFNNKFISLTGGEPLHHSSFLKNWLPEFNKHHQKKYIILLESSGILYKELEEIIEDIDVVSMDIKLASVTKMRSFWEEHRQFIQIARKKELYIKVVVGEETPHEEWQQAIKLVEQECPYVPLIIQPMTPQSKTENKISHNKLKKLFDIAKQDLSNVRVIPQIHVQAQWL